MKEVTDPRILEQLNQKSMDQPPQAGNPSEMTEVTDPDILAQLNQPAGPSPVKSSQNQDPAMRGLENSGSPVDYINSAGAGVAKGILDTGADLGNLVTDAVGSVSPGARDSLRSVGRKVYDVLDPTGNPIVDEAVAKNPMTNTVGNIVGQVAPYAVPGLGATKAGNLGLAATAGAAQTDDGLLNRAIGAGTGLIAAKALDIVGNLAQKGVSALRTTRVVKDLSKYVDDQVVKLNSSLTGTPREVGAKSIANKFNATQDTDTALFDKFRKVEGNFRPEIRSVSRGIEDLADNFEPFLTGPQKQTLTKANEVLSQNYSIADLHDVRKLMAGMSRSFTPKEAGPKVAEAFKAVRTNIDDSLRNMTQKAGVYDDYLLANEHYQTALLPMINSGADDVAKALSPQGMKTNPTAAAKVLDTYIDKHIIPNSPNKTQAFLQTLDPVGRQAVEVRALQKTLEKVQHLQNPALALKTEIKKLGTTADVLFKGENKMMLDGVTKVLDEADFFIRNQFKTGELGGIAGQLITAIPKAMADNPAVAFILKTIGNPSTPKAVIKEFVEKGAAIMGGETVKAIRNDSSSEGNNYGN